MKVHPLFKNRSLAIISKHQKERVLAPLFEGEIRANVFVGDGFDTDSFGTFSGKVTREKNPLETLKKKCRAGLDWFGIDMGVASEGSFGPHPFIPFITANEEWIIFMDTQHNIEIIERSISTETNFNRAKIEHLGELFAFVKTAGFPEHGIILKDAEEHASLYFEDILSYEELIQAYYKLKQQSTSIFAETDMRAHRNPTRMKHIEKVGKQLIESLLSTCPKCEYPGFKIQHIINGLPCKSCGKPTRKALEFQKICNSCAHINAERFPQGTTADPAYCDYCNP